MAVSQLYAVIKLYNLSYRTELSFCVSFSCRSWPWPLSVNPCPFRTVTYLRYTCFIALSQELQVQPQRFRFYCLVNALRTLTEDPSLLLLRNVFIDFYFYAFACLARQLKVHSIIILPSFPIFYLPTVKMFSKAMSCENCIRSLIAKVIQNDSVPQSSTTSLASKKNKKYDLYTTPFVYGKPNG
ncbi:hypothetical protein BDF20DRAFT_830994 [Mycotypha africana]|uniref:uncharacterized protein n=1 Tax=Mycotypha africana TaxID=64632 RepID=UPI002301DD57|nr:uncharacterized protein BDF20DRAFT_830994 [Mycotypha africana]KAI8990905.1 hypothetical protein BDF20DRAFT_830994 [Mycotypha africana]